MTAVKQFVRLPGKSDRITIVGRTGSGKTVAALWHLYRQLRRDPEFPWVIFDSKVDDSIAELRATEIGFGVPREPGLYVTHPLPHQADEMEAQMWAIFDAGDIGVYFDEGSMANNDAMEAILRQGRSRHIPAIVLNQRPVWITRSAFSEASFIQAFQLIDGRDQDRIREFSRIDMEAARLRPHESWYYDVSGDRVVKFLPVPPPSKIAARINALVAPPEVERRAI